MYDNLYIQPIHILSKKKYFNIIIYNNKIFKLL